MRALHRRGHRGARRRRRPAGLRGGAPRRGPCRVRRAARPGDRGPRRRSTSISGWPPATTTTSPCSSCRPRSPCAGRRAATCTPSRSPGHPHPGHPGRPHLDAGRRSARRPRDLCTAVAAAADRSVAAAADEYFDALGRGDEATRRRRGHRPARRRQPRPGACCCASSRPPRCASGSCGSPGGGASRRSMRRPASPNGSSPRSAPGPEAGAAAATSCSPAWTGSGTRWPRASSARCCDCTTGGSRSSGRACRTVHLVSFLHHARAGRRRAERSHCRSTCRRRTRRSSPRSAPGRRCSSGAPDSVRTAAGRRRLGADAWAPTAADAVALLADRLPWPSTAAAGPGRPPDAMAPSTRACGSGAGGWWSRRWSGCGRSAGLLRAGHPVRLPGGRRPRAGGGRAGRGGLLR